MPSPLQLETLEAAYAEACSGQSDMNEHVPTLRRLASQCKRVVEFGVRDGVSTAALLMGCQDGDGELMSYDRQPCPQAVEGAYRLGGDRFTFIRGESLELTIFSCDLLLIDTTHQYRVLAEELRRHAPKVFRWVACHDTAKFGLRGDDGGDGLLLAVGEFLVNNRSWRVAEHHPNCHGLTVLERRP